jgi:sulfoxide reductase heme-binding subunit YedZ
MYILLRIAVHLGALLPLVWLYFAIPSGALGADPIKELIHFLGLGAIRLCLLSLLITPLTRQLKRPRLIALRRPLGLWCFTWATLHILAWAVLDLALDWNLIIGEVLKRSYIWFGLIAWLFLMLMSITSLPVLLRKMGRHWKKLHGFIYPSIILLCIHYWWAIKSGWIEPALYLALALCLLGYRYKQLKRWAISFYR